VFSFGSKLLLELRTSSVPVIRHQLEPGPRHNEVRAVLSDPQKFWYGGHEDGPVMHSGDADSRQIHATGVLGSVSK
jgi:hypothetical protein